MLPPAPAVIFIVAGDFKMPDIDRETLNCKGEENSKEFQFLEAVRDSYLEQHVKEHTRKTEDSEPSLIDLLFTNNTEMVDNVFCCSPLGK